MKKKVTIMCLHTGIGGIEKYVASLTKMLSINYEVRVVATYKVKNRMTEDFDKNVKIDYLINDYPRKEEYRQAIKKKNIIKIIIYGFKLFKTLILKYYRNIKAIKKNESDYIITTRYFHNKLVGKYRKKGIVTIATEHNFHNNNEKYIKKIVSSCFNIDYFVLVSNSLKEFYESRIKNTKCLYIPPVIDKIPKYEKKNKVSNRLISVGRLSEEKGFDDLIDIIDILKNKIPNIKLDIYGGGKLKEYLNKQIKSKELEKNIELKGTMPHDKLVNEMKKYDIYLMSSHTESFGLVIIEAFSNSIPVIAFDSADGAKNLLSDGRGILIENRDKEKYAAEVYKLLKNVEAINNLSKKGYDSLKEYDVESVRKKWENLLECKNN